MAFQSINEISEIKSQVRPLLRRSIIKLILTRKPLVHWNSFYGNHCLWEKASHVPFQTVNNEFCFVSLRFASGLSDAQKEIFTRQWQEPINEDISDKFSSSNPETDHPMKVDSNGPWIDVWNVLSNFIGFHPLSEFAKFYRSNNSINLLILWFHDLAVESLIIWWSTVGRLVIGGLLAFLRFRMQTSPWNHAARICGDGLLRLFSHAFSSDAVLNSFNLPLSQVTNSRGTICEMKWSTVHCDNRRKWCWLCLLCWIVSSLCVSHGSLAKKSLFPSIFLSIQRSDRSVYQSILIACSPLNLTSKLILSSCSSVSIT
jgi:hypothetical protein